MTADRKPSDPISVMLADSNPLVLTAMSEMVERDRRFSLAATSATAEGFLGTAMRVSVDVGVLEWDIPTLGAAKLIEIIREQKKGPRIVVYGDDTAEAPRLAMAAGAAGFFARSGEVEQLLDTCEAVAAGQMVFPFLDVRDLQQDPMQQLSRAQRKMLHALSKGLTNRELARELGISINTVKFHLSNLYDKLAVKNRAQAIAFYYATARKTQGK